MARRWLKANTKTAGTPGGPQADAVIDHPPPFGTVIELDYLPTLLAPDPGGVAPRAGTLIPYVEALQTPVQHSPVTNWSPGTPYPGPPAQVVKYVDIDSMRWWGRTGQGQLIWSGETEFSGDLVPSIPQDMVQHIDNWSLYLGGFPNIARNRPPAFGDQTPTFNPVYDFTFGGGFGS